MIYDVKRVIPVDEDGKESVGIFIHETEDTEGGLLMYWIERPYGWEFEHVEVTRAMRDRFCSQMLLGYFEGDEEEELAIELAVDDYSRDLGQRFQPSEWILGAELVIQPMIQMPARAPLTQVKYNMLHLVFDRGNFTEVGYFLHKANQEAGDETGTLMYLEVDEVNERTLCHKEDDYQLGDWKQMKFIGTIDESRLEETLTVIGNTTANPRHDEESRSGSWTVQIEQRLINRGLLPRPVSVGRTIPEFED